MGGECASALATYYTKIGLREYVMSVIPAQAGMTDIAPRISALPRTIRAASTLRAKSAPAPLQSGECARLD